MLYLFEEELVKKEWEEDDRKYPESKTPMEHYIYKRFRKVCQSGIPTETEKKALAYLVELVEAFKGFQNADEQMISDDTFMIIDNLKSEWDAVLQLMELSLEDATGERRLYTRILLEFLRADLINMSQEKPSLPSEQENRVYRLVGRCSRMLREYGLDGYTLEAAENAEGNVEESTEENVADNTEEKAGKNTGKNAAGNALGNAGKNAREIDDDKAEIDIETATPAQIKAYLDRYVIGQEAAKRTIATAIFAHGIRIRHPETHFPNGTVLLIGPSGCGKTEIMRRIRDIAGLPMVFTDVSSLGMEQSTGRHMEDILLNLWQAAGKDIERAEHGIVFLDEFDKLLLPAYAKSGLDKSNEVQSQLLTVLEGTTIEMRFENKQMVFDTSNLLFIFAGAFHGIEEDIRQDKLKRVSGSSIGFGGLLAKELSNRITRENINHEVLISYGMKRELAGRISDIAVLERLSEEELVRIMTEAEGNVWSCYQREVELVCGAKLSLSKDMVCKIAREVREDETGARALHGRLRALVRDILYEQPNRRSMRDLESIEIDEKGRWNITYV